MKINVGLFGASGKMGKAVEQMLPAMKTKNTLIPFLCISKNTSPLFAMTATHINNVEAELLDDVDVWIDFTSGEGLMQLLKATEKFKTPVVSGSTGLSDSEFATLKKSSKKRAVLWASNMSPGLWAFRQAMKGLSSISNFDFAMEEIHHTQKKDRPSGTAKTLHLDLEKIANKKIETPTSFRLGGVFGVHTLYAASSNEVITMQHQALNRTVFAEGSLMVCDWLVHKKPGYYSMDDMFLSKKQRNKNKSKK
jgi:4-hydroxy-tetrahydrodipicolinate reductase